MAETSELIEFRRAFVWLLCGMLLPSVALVAFGVVAVANERAAVERRLAEDYDARVRALGLDLLARLDKWAKPVAAGKPDPLVLTVQPLGKPPAELADAARRAATLPIGGHVFATAEMGSERRALALVRADNHRTLIDPNTTPLNSTHYLISYAVFCLKKKNTPPPPPPPPPPPSHPPPPP